MSHIRQRLFPSQLLSSSILLLRWLVAPSPRARSSQKNTASKDTAAAENYSGRIRTQKDTEVLHSEKHNQNHSNVTRMCNVQFGKKLLYF